MTDPEIKALHAWGHEGWDTANAMMAECRSLLATNEANTNALIAQGKEADPVAVAVVMTVAVIVRRINEAAAKALTMGGVG